MDTMVTKDLISECADWILEEVVKRECEKVCISTDEVARALRIPFNFVYDHDKEIKKELNKFPIVAWTNSLRGFEIELWEIVEKKGRSGTMEVVSVPDSFGYTDQEKVKALDFTVSMLKEKLRVLEEEYPEMKYTANKLKGCIEEVRIIADKIANDMEVNFYEDLDDELDSDPYAVEWK